MRGSLVRAKMLCARWQRDPGEDRQAGSFRHRDTHGADFRGRREPASLKREPAQKIDAIDELMRIVAAAEPDLAHRANERNFADRLRRPQGRR
jgi:hypothetical protein